MPTHSRFVFRPFVALLFAGLCAPAPAADPPSDLALVPPDAIGFAHLRIADLWKSDAFADYRQALTKAGPDVLATLDKQFAPAPSSIDRTTIIVLPPAGPGGEPGIVFVARYARPFDKDRVMAGVSPDLKATTVDGREFYAAPGAESAIYFADDRTTVVSTPAGLSAVLSRRPGPAGRLADAISRADGRHLVTAAVDVEKLPLPPNLVDQVPPPFRPLLKAGVVTLTAGGDARLAVRADYPSDADAAAAEKAVKDAVGMARGFIAQGRKELDKTLAGPGKADPRPIDQLGEAAAAAVALGMLNTAEEFLNDLPVKRDGTALALDVEVTSAITRNLSTAPILAGLLLPAVQKVREAAARSTSVNNLKQIGLAMHNYHDAHGNLPAAAITDKATGKPLLSWRVAILPYVEQDGLYKKFKLDEPWDSDHNKKLIPLMPKVYADPRIGVEPGKTIYKVLVGADKVPTAFDATRGRRFNAITDGLSNTLMAVAGGESVVWTKPEDIAYDPDGPLPDLSRPGPTLLVLFCDGSVRSLGEVGEKVMRALITASHGEVVELP